MDFIICPSCRSPALEALSEVDTCKGEIFPPGGASPFSVHDHISQFYTSISCDKVSSDEVPLPSSDNDDDVL